MIAAFGREYFGQNEEKMAEVVDWKGYIGATVNLFHLSG